MAVVNRPMRESPKIERYGPRAAAASELEFEISRELNLLPPELEAQSPGIDSHAGFDSWCLRDWLPSAKSTVRVLVE